MIVQNKNKWGSENALLPYKSRLKTKSKILVLGLMLIIVFIGLFKPVRIML